MGKNEILISHDVVSLFTKTPVGATLQIVQQHLQKDRNLKKCTHLTVQGISQLLHFIATSTYFQFRTKIYRQKEGFAMGDPLSAINVWLLYGTPGEGSNNISTRGVQAHTMEAVRGRHSGKSKERTYTRTHRSPQFHWPHWQHQVPTWRRNR